ncbi:hypothetical protein [Rubritalea tangerina]|uniref:hypothetical protein n=1 Tax=Rubritalea tangerina TaxID=430798 RepID=UPI0036087B47
MAHGIKHTLSRVIDSLADIIERSDDREWWDKKKAECCEALCWCGVDKFLGPHGLEKEKLVGVMRVRGRSRPQY